MALNGIPIDPAATYRVTTNDFLANGGDGFTSAHRRHRPGHRARASTSTRWPPTSAPAAGRAGPAEPDHPDRADLRRASPATSGARPRTVAPGPSVDDDVDPAADDLDLHHRADLGLDAGPGEVIGRVRVGVLVEGAAVDGDLAAVVLTAGAVVRRVVLRDRSVRGGRDSGEYVVVDHPGDAVGRPRGVLCAAPERGRRARAGSIRQLEPASWTVRDRGRWRDGVGPVAPSDATRSTWPGAQSKAQASRTSSTS